jgi:hypothetical protein
MRSLGSPNPRTAVRPTTTKKRWTTYRKAPSIPCGCCASGLRPRRLGTVPRDVAAIAMRMIGALAAGDAAAWRKVKQAKDMPRQVIIGRVGIHHRLLLRTDEGHSRSSIW